MSEPRTAASIMATNFEERRLEMRDRQVAMSLGADMVARFFKPEEIEDMRDVRQQMQRACEMAAYEAIQKERELHTGDMAQLSAWMVARTNELLYRPITLTVDAGRDSAEGR